MYLVVKNKLISVSGSSYAYNEKKEKVFIIKGNWFSNKFSKKYKKTIKSLDKKTHFKVCNKRIHGIKRTCYIFDASGNEVAHVEELGIAKAGYKIEGTKQKLEIIAAHSIGAFYSIVMDGKQIGTIGPEKKDDGRTKFNLTDTFRIDFEDKDDASFMVALVIAIDNIRDANKRATKKH